MTRKAVVIGAGITGGLVARELLLAGWSVDVVEARHVGAGSSSRTAAGIRQQFSTPSTVRGMRYSVRRYLELADELGGELIHQVGYLFLGDDPAAASARVAMQRAAGLAEVEHLSPAAAATRFPWLDPATFAAATFCPSDGFLHPATVYNEAARRVRELGGRIVQGAPVIGADHAGGRISRVHTPKGAFEGDLFIDATNAWTGQLAHHLGAAPLPVSPLKRYLWFLRRDDAALDAATFAAMPLVILPSGVYCRPENADTLLVGWAHDARPEPGLDWDDQDRVEPGFGHDGDADTWPMQAWMHLATHLPPLGGFAGLVATTSGYYATTPDHNPFLGYDAAVPNLLRLVGFSGHGAMFGPFTAAVAAALADAGRDLPTLRLPEGEVDLAAFAPNRTFDAHEALVI
jgi:glycine/D-amino acid oxidase-like deaminating enzyme